MAFWRRKPLTAEQLRKRGSRRLERGQLERALEDLQRAADLEPHSFEGRTNLGSALYMAGRPAEALPHFEYVLAIDPDHPTALLNLAACHDALGDIDKSIAALRELLRIRPQWRDGHYNLAIALMKTEDYEGAKEALIQELQINPDNAAARDLLNRLHLKLPSP